MRAGGKFRLICLTAALGLNAVLWALLIRGALLAFGVS